MFSSLKSLKRKKRKYHPTSRYAEVSFLFKHTYHPYSISRTTRLPNTQLTMSPVSRLQRAPSYHTAYSQVPWPRRPKYRYYTAVLRYMHKIFSFCLLKRPTADDSKSRKLCQQMYTIGYVTIQYTSVSSISSSRFTHQQYVHATNYTICSHRHRISSVPIRCKLPSSYLIIEHTRQLLVSLALSSFYQTVCNYNIHKLTFTRHTCNRLRNKLLSLINSLPTRHILCIRWDRK